MTSTLLERILREGDGADVLELLAERLTPTDLQSLMLEVYRRRAARQAPAALQASYERNPFVRPATISPAALLEVDRLAFALAAPQFTPLELAPVCPLGTNASVGAADQNKTIATARNTEVVSDSTNVLALECAARRRQFARDPARRHERVALCASHRLLRPQPFKGAASFAHFRLFALCTAGRDEGSFRFELAALLDHLRFYLRLLAALQAQGAGLHGLDVRVTDLDGTRADAVAAVVFAPLAEEFPQAQARFDPERVSGRIYYAGLCFAIYASDATGQAYMLVDGGFTTWTQQLLNNAKERLLISGIGTERLCSVFGAGEM